MVSGPAARASRYEHARRSPRLRPAVVADNLNRASSLRPCLPHERNAGEKRKDSCNGLRTDRDCHHVSTPAASGAAMKSVSAALFAYSTLPPT